MDIRKFFGGELPSFVGVKAEQDQNLSLTVLFYPNRGEEEEAGKFRQ